MEWHSHSSVYIGGLIPSLSFDPYAPLLHVGSSSGSIGSHVALPAGLGDRAYVKAVAHRGVVAAMEPIQNGLLSVGGGMPGMGAKGEASIRLGGRQGGTIWSAPAGTHSQLTAIVPSPSLSSSIIVSGPAEAPLIIVNLYTGLVTRRMPSPVGAANGLTHLRRAGPTAIVAATTAGSLVLLDPRTEDFRVGETRLAHSAGVGELEVDGNYAVTTGFTSRQGHLLPDPFLKLYDLRTLRLLPPVSLPAPPHLIKFHPRLGATVLAASLAGHVHPVDVRVGQASTEGSFHVDLLPPPNAAHTGGSYLRAMAVAPTGEGLAFADSEGLISLYTSFDPHDAESVTAPEHHSFWRGEGLGELADPPVADFVVEAAGTDWKPDTPLNLVGMPYYTSPLLSILQPDSAGSLAQHRKKATYTTSAHPSLPVAQFLADPDLVRTIKQVDFVGYAPYPSAWRAARKRNQVALVGAQGAGKREVPLFRSEREMRRLRTGKGKKESLGGALDGAEEELEEQDKGRKMPEAYRRVEIMYSRFGVEDFDFAYYNRTRYSGLETHISNSYTNALLQALHYTSPLRTVAQSHIVVDCRKENCLLCETGFLTRMLGDAQGRNCQASNFLRAFAANDRVSALGLLDQEAGSNAPGGGNAAATASSLAYASLIQIFNRYLLEQFISESDVSSPQVESLLVRRDLPAPDEGKLPPPVMAQVLRIEGKSLSTCQCGAITSRDVTATSVDMLYPRKALSNELPPASDFASLVKNSLQRETVARLACSSCKKTQHFKIKRDINVATLPPVMSLNAGVRTAEELDFWTRPPAAEGEQFLSRRIRITKNEGEGFSVSTLREDEANSKGGVVYNLRAMVVQIQAEDDPPHLVSLCRVKDTADSWHLFNDFLVRPISVKEALNFQGGWKIPAILFFEREDLGAVLDLKGLPVVSDTKFLVEDHFISRRRDLNFIKHETLKPDEVPRKGTLISIDAEFVSLQQEEAEFHSDGTKRVLRPVRMSLARVSVLRGEGESTGIPFIDDHIHTSEPVVDYLTEFSGIIAGDLDPSISRHTVVPLKAAYKKLRLLVDLGCIFIGHGLNKDFRIINIFVPPSQIIDTVDIYILPHRQRKLSLRFLAWAVLGMDIQSDSHDSIEDARTALQLYEEHNRLEAEGIWEDRLDEIYSKGAKTNFKVPGSDPPVPSVALATAAAFPNLEGTFPPQAPQGQYFEGAAPFGAGNNGNGMRQQMTSPPPPPPPQGGQQQQQQHHHRGYNRRGRRN